ncbi:hypothetical protein [Amycolatopsis tucumanensis]|uniref:hypothetical protein n=1 Tax=Amycolatopsis tucumanensis TaxID=401106 RepID=UPI001F277B8B|nr:hypothetical protein [Amycolatopsis tucumanensis]
MERAPHRRRHGRSSFAEVSGEAGIRGRGGLAAVATVHQEHSEHDPPIGIAALMFSATG